MKHTALYRYPSKSGLAHKQIVKHTAASHDHHVSCYPLFQGERPKAAFFLFVSLDTNKLQARPKVDVRWGDTA